MIILPSTFKYLSVLVVLLLILVGTCEWKFQKLHTTSTNLVLDPTVLVFFGTFVLVLLGTYFPKKNPPYDSYILVLLQKLVNHSKKLCLNLFLSWLFHSCQESCCLWEKLLEKKNHIFNLRRSSRYFCSWKLTCGLLLEGSFSNGFIHQPLLLL